MAVQKNGVTVGTVALVLAVLVCLVPNTLSVNQTVEWTVKQNMPGPKADGAAATYNGKLYVFGGYNQTAVDPRTETFCYDPASNVWTAKANMPTARWGPVAVEFSGKIYVFGGEAKTGPVYVNEVYDPATDTWTTMANLPWGRFYQGLMAVRCGDKIELFYKASHYQYDPVANTYTSKAGMPTPRCWGTCAFVNGKIYLIGGYSQLTGRATNVNEVYDPATNSWFTKTPMPIAKYGVTRENPVLNGRIFVSHGLNDDGFHVDNYAYDPTADSWSQEASATYPRDGVSCGVINDTFYVVGGRADYWGPYGVLYNEAYDPPTSRLINVNITLEPFGLVMQYSISQGDSITLPGTIQMWQRVWTFNSWNDGTASLTKSFNTDGNFGAVYT